uniref:Ribosome maturation protein SBDS n=1 Tax=Tabanus bromius TaxID=304241 RepID=A0A0K8TNN4_TABBR
MSKIFTPTNQIRLTNVAVVRLKKCGKRFEIACYKNKVVSWRNNVEKDIDEVLQTHTVFLNVSKGKGASKSELQAAFGTSDQTEICKEILAKGELQISEKERDAQIDTLFANIVTNVARMCVNTDTRRPYPVTIIEKALKDAHFSVKPNKNAKQQTLEAIQLLKTTMPLDRSRMKVKISFPYKGNHKLKSTLTKMAIKVESEEPNDNDVQLIMVIDPGQFREADELVRDQTKGQGLVELLQLAEVVEKDEAFE